MRPSTEIETLNRAFFPREWQIALMTPRIAQQSLAQLLAQFPAVVLLGPRQVGKTTVALAETEKHAGVLYLDLELPSAQRQMDDPEAFLLAHRGRLVILDEVQRLPELFAVLRGVIDIRRREGEAAGQFLLLGLASGVLLQQASESLAGRAAQLELAPFQAREVLPAWHGNVGKRLVRARKVYVRDSGIVHALLGLASLEAVLAHTVAGASWEGFVIEQLLAPSASAAASFCRTAHGAEADLVLRFHDGETWVVEIKRASALTTSKGFHQAATDVGATKRLLLAPVATSYPTRVGVAVMPPCRGQAAGRPRKAIAVPHCWRER